MKKIILLTLTVISFSAIKPAEEKPAKYNNNPNAINDFLYGADRGDIDLLKQGIENNVDVNVRGGNSNGTALIYAVRQGREQVIPYLLSVPNIDVNKTDFRGRTPLLLAVESGTITGPSMVQLLVKAPNIKLNAPDPANHNWTALKIAQERSRHESWVFDKEHSYGAIVKILEDAGASEQPE